MTYVGIDLHTTNMVNVALNDNAEIVRRAKLPTGTRSLEDFFGNLEAHIQGSTGATVSAH